MNRIIIITVIYFLAAGMPSNAQNARDIIKKADEKMQGEETSQSTMTMTIVRPSWERVITFKSWTKGRDYSLSLITAPAREKGQTFLKRKNEGIKTFIGGGEESYGFMIGDFIRDKDAVSAIAILAEIAAWAADQNKTIYDLLIDIYLEYGFYKESLVSIVRKGKSGAEEISQMMTDFRSNPPQTILGSKVVIIKDYELSVAKDTENNSETPIDLPKSNVLQFFTADGTKVSCRPSGTEPKIKFYIGLKADLCSKEKFDEVNSPCVATSANTPESMGPTQGIQMIPRVRPRISPDQRPLL